MKSITDALAAHLAGDVTSTSRLWKIKRKATAQASPAVAYYAGPNYSDLSCDQAELGSLGDWEFVNGQWRTTAAAAAGTELDWLYAWGFGFDIPATATIIGVVASVVYTAQGPTASYIQEVSLFNAGSPPSPIGAEKTPHLQFMPSQQTMGQGAKTDMWGLATSTLDPTLVNSSNFGFGIRPYYDGVRLCVSQFSLTVYYTLPAGSGTILTLSSSLIQHTNFTGEAESDTSSDAQACAAGASPIFDSDGTLYINDYNGNVHKFEGATGAYLGVLGVFGTPSVSPHYSRRSDSGGMRIMNHPIYGKWLVVADGPVWGMDMQAMAIDGKDAGGNPVSAGTVTNVISTMYGGLSSGGNSGGWDVDASGNIWLFGTDNGGANAGLLLLKQVTFTATNTIAITATSNHGSLFAWTQANGVAFDPVSATLILFGSGPSGGYTARVDQNNAFAVKATAGFSGPPLNVGGNGCFVLPSSDFCLVRCSDLSVQSTYTFGEYAVSSVIREFWYDAVNNFCWINTRDGNNVCWVLDLNDPTTSGASQLKDPGNQQPSSAYLCTGGLVVSPDGSYACTNYQGNNGGPSVGFIDFFGAALASAGGLTAPTITMGFRDADQDVTL